MKLIGKRILIELDEKESKTDSGIILSDEENLEFTRGKVVLLSEKVTDLSIGQTIIYKKFADTNEFTFNGKRCLIINESSVESVVD